MANPLTVIASLGAGKNEVKVGVVKRDWVPTGRIDFATKLDNNDDPNQPNQFKLLVKNVELSKAFVETKTLRFSGGSPH
jgi:hypothetical protein